jgi:hypothetical protein
VPSILGGDESIVGARPASNIVLKEDGGTFIKDEEMKEPTGLVEFADSLGCLLDVVDSQKVEPSLSFPSDVGFNDLC